MEQPKPENPAPKDKPRADGGANIVMHHYNINPGSYSQPRGQSHAEQDPDTDNPTR